MSFTLESRSEIGGLLKILCDVVTHAVQIGVLITFMDHTWAADLDQNRRAVRHLIHHIKLFCSELEEMSQKR